MRRILAKQFSVIPSESFASKAPIALINVLLNSEFYVVTEKGVDLFFNSDKYVKPLVAFPYPYIYCRAIYNSRTYTCLRIPLDSFAHIVCSSLALSVPDEMSLL